MAFAIFLCEIKNMKFRRVVQTLTTVPNFISWVLVYAIAFCIFSTDGFVSSLMVNAGIWKEGVNMLMGGSHVWLQMLAWGLWKGIGWSAIIYIAAISGIDQQLYEAATVDGAGRFQRMWNITVPSLIPTFCVLLLMSIANILSNGMDQYLVFENSTNTSSIMVLDLYVYKLGIGQGQIPLSTVIGMVKSVVSVTLLFAANGISKLIRGESIV
jgi:putative aldouronate transport system permease protein